MKKEMRNGIIYFALFVLFLILVLVLFFPNFFLKYILAPTLSPFFPDLAPFEASVTILQNWVPIILYTDNEIFVCEDTALNYRFNVSDLNRDLDFVRIDPSNPFFAEIINWPNASEFIYGARIFSGILRKDRVDRAIGYRKYMEEIFAVDRAGFSDSRKINITVIEINHKPNMSIIGVRTVWTHGDDSIFYYQTQVIDMEDGTQNDGRLFFNITFLNGVSKLFNISSNGTMYFAPNVTLNLSEVSLPITYNISVCVNDTGLIAIHPMIDICLQEGNGTSLGTCQRFSLTVTDENRPPIIIFYYPIELNFSARGEEEIYFNISVRDPDGTIPDAYWYVDNSFIEYDNSSSFDEFRYTFGCGISGEHKIRVDVTDGLLNASLQWNVSVEGVSCPVEPSGGGGGGGVMCRESWGCLDWNVCQNMESSFELNVLNEKDIEKIRADCKNDFIPQESCGFQIRGCMDVNLCKSIANKPDEIQNCYFTKNPNCADGIKNCHDNSCELLVDCGGPCSTCPTCSDSIQNQGEGGIDCGGPCPVDCPIKPPIYERIWFYYSLILLILLLIIIVIVQLIRMWLRRKKIRVSELPVKKAAVEEEIIMEKEIPIVKKEAVKKSIIKMETKKIKKKDKKRNELREFKLNVKIKKRKI